MLSGFPFSVNIVGLPVHKRKAFILLLCVVCQLSRFSGKAISLPFSGVWEEGYVERNSDKEENKLLVRQKVGRKMQKLMQYYSKGESKGIGAIKDRSWATLWATKKA